MAMSINFTSDSIVCHYTLRECHSLYRSKFKWVFTSGGHTHVQLYEELLLVLPVSLNCKSLLFVEFIVKLHPLIMYHKTCNLFVLILYIIQFFGSFLRVRVRLQSSAETRPSSSGAGSAQVYGSCCYFLPVAAARQISRWGQKQNLDLVRARSSNSTILASFIPRHATILVAVLLATRTVSRPRHK